MYELVIHNIDRLYSSALGGDPSEYDRCVVLDLNETEQNIITGKPQSKIVYVGTLKECHDWIRDHSVEEQSACQS